MPTPITRNTLFYGDNLSILRDHVPTESVDLIYLDPPFNSNRSYNVLFKNESGQSAESQIQAFDDTWHWGASAEEIYDQLTQGENPAVAAMISAMRQFIGTNQMMAYLVMMAARLVELHRVLKPTGSLYLHCDPTASHYLKVVLDTIFGVNNFRNDIVWERYSRPKGSQFESRKFGVATDNLFLYTKTDGYVFYRDRVRVNLSNDEIINRYTLVDEKGVYYSGPLLRSSSMGVRPNLVYEYRGFTPGPEGWRMTIEKLAELDQNGDMFFTSNGIPRRKVRPTENPVQVITNLWTDIQAIGSQAAERLGYPTQKPLALLERIIQASSNPGDVVLDPFSGCGTAISAAEKLGRKWIGIDITHLAISMHKNRLKEHFNLEPGKDYDVIGEPQDLAGAIQLASEDRYQFQWWALSLIKARPLGGAEGSKVGKKGSDKGIDGVIPFMDDASKKLKRVIVSVKSGHVNSPMVRDLHGVIEREPDAPIGVFITLEEPSTEMIKEAVTAGFYTSPLWDKKYPRIQIYTIENLLNGDEVKMPPAFGAFKQAERIKKVDGIQAELEM